MISPAGGDPENEAMLADAVGLALMVVLKTLPPAERLAFVLRDMFAVPFGHIAPMLDRTPAATRQLASRGRRRVKEEAPVPDADLAQQRAVIEAFFMAARDGDFAGLVAVLDPDIVLRADGGWSATRHSVTIRTAREVAAQAVLATKFAPYVRPVLINGTAGVVAVIAGKPFSVMAFTVVGGTIAEVDVMYDPERLASLPLAFLADTPSGPPADDLADPRPDGA